jgi:hypothetical protein
MGLVSKRTDRNAPAITKTFTTFAAAQVLHEATGSTATGAAPAGINHLPSSIYVKAAAADVLEYIDALGVTNSLTFVRAFDGTLPFVFASLTTNTTVDSVTVAWHK